MQVISRSAEEPAMELLVAALCLPGDPWQRGRDTASFELPGRIKCTQKGKARKYDVLRLPRQRETCAFRPPGACIAALELPPARKMACSGMRVVWEQGCALDETSGWGAWWRWPAPAPAWRSGTRRTLCRCGTIVFARRVGLWCPDTEPAT